MNFNYISQLLDNGLDSDHLIALLVKNAPNLGNKIKKLLAGGWGSNEILSYINKDQESSKINLKNAKPATPEEIAALQAYKSRRGSDKSRDEKALEDLTKFSKGALKVGGSISSPYLAGKVIQTGMGALESLIKPSNVQPGTNIGQQVGQQAKAPVAQAIQPNQAIPEAPIVQQPAAQIHPLPPALHNLVGNFLSKGLNLDDVSDITKQFEPKIVNEYEKATNTPIRSAIEEFSKTLSQTQQPPQNTPQQAIQQPAVNAISQTIEEEQPKVEEKKTVVLPNGDIGEIESVKQGIAKVKVGDNFRHKKLEELMESPKEAAQAALELLKSFTPENLRSAHHALNTYDPTTRSAQFLFHNGEGYLVEDISPEEYEKLSNEIEEAKTSGESPIGAWATGQGSRGAAYNKIIKDFATPKDKRKHKPYRKIQVGYNIFKEFQRLINEKE